MPPTRREKQYAATCEEVKETARRLMAEQGTAGISLRAIARAMGLSAPALYHYYASHDAIITALIVYAFHALADALAAARDATEGDAVAQLWSVVTAYRAWALDHPTDFQLIYGNPIPGYAAPREITVPAAVRAFVVISEVLVRAQAVGTGTPTPEYAVVPEAVAGALQARITQDGYSISVLAFYLTMTGWYRMHGLIMLELFHHIQPVVGDSATFYRVQMVAMFREMGLVGQSWHAPTVATIHAGG